MDNSNLRTVFLVVYQSYLRTLCITIYLWIYLFYRDFMELPARTYAESCDATALQGFVEKASKEVATSQDDGVV